MAKKKDPDDDQLFREWMADVKPLAAEPRVRPEKGRLSPQPRRDAAGAAASSGFVEREHAPAIGPEEALRFARSGVQPRLLRQLRRGELRPEARLDLHGHTTSEAGALLSAFLSDAQAAGLRCVHVVHGKGHRSAEGRPVLKAQVNQWLRDAPEILAFASALPRDGGTGTLYVLLRRG